MSSRSPQLRTAALFLSPELLRLICAWLNIWDLYRMALTSRGMWDVASPYLWQYIDCIDRVVNLMQAPTNAEANAGHSGHGHLELNDENMKEGSAPATSHGVARIGRFVRSLIIYESSRMDLLDRSGPLVQAFINEAGRRPLFTSLYSLSLGPLEWELGNGRTERWLYSDDSLDFLKLLISGSVRRLALECKPGSLEIDNIRKAAPDIIDLRLWLSEGDHPRYPLEDQISDVNTWKLSTIADLRSWERLSTLSISSAFLNSTTASLLGTIPALQSLEVVCDGLRDWDLLQIESDSFLSLTSFFVINTYPHDVTHLLDQPGLMGSLTTLRLDITDSARSSSIVEDVEEYVACVDSLCQHSPSLSHLIFRANVLLDERILQSLSSLHFLTILDMSSMTIPTDMAPIFLTLPPGLQYLDVDELMAPAFFLEEVAMRYHTLHFLAIGILLEGSLDAPEIDTPIEGQICIRYSVKRAPGKSAIGSDTEKYILRIWPNALMYQTWSPPFKNCYQSRS